MPDGTIILKAYIVDIVSNMRINYFKRLQND